MKRRLLFSAIRPCAAIALCGALSGCVAALAVPAMTAAGVLSEQKRKEQPTEAEHLAERVQTPASAPAEAVQLTELTELPPPSPSPSDAEGEAWRYLARYTLDQAVALSAGSEVESALLAPGSAVSLQARKRVCTDREPAILIDLDPGETTFTPPATLAAGPTGIEALGRLREAGVVVLWISQAGSDQIGPIAKALKDSGLDPTGRDPILLALNEGDRKQVLREQANEAVCMLAIAGGERADFDELFDYLRDPTLGTMYDSLLGAGWFLVPPVFAAPPVAP